MLGCLAVDVSKVTSSIVNEAQAYQVNHDYQALSSEQNIVNILGVSLLTKRRKLMPILSIIVDLLLIVTISLLFFSGLTVSTGEFTFVSGTTFSLIALLVGVVAFVMNT